MSASADTQPSDLVVVTESEVFGIYRYQLVDGTYERVPITTTTTEHHYVTQNGKVVRETIGTGETAQVLDFIYDESGKPFALKYTNGTADPVTYYYVLNLQGDVVKLVEHRFSGRVYNLITVAKYTYDAWGKPLSTTGGEGNSVANTHIAKLNPLRYRGYYFDMETGFYYLQSRYYDPTLRRFINADSYQSTGTGFLGYNMFAYCENNPVLNHDPDGRVVARTWGCAVELLRIWLTGDGSYQKFGETSSVSNAFKRSDYMNAILESCVEEYKNSGKSSFRDDAYISGYSEFDLWMAVRSFKYEITVRSETIVYENPFFRVEYVVYYCDVRIMDTYNFNSNTDSGDGLGSRLNNFAYDMHQKGIGTDYAWEANYTKSFSDNNDDSDLFSGLFVLLV